MTKREALVLVAAYLIILALVALVLYVTRIPVGGRL